MFEVGDKIRVINAALKCFNATGTIHRLPSPVYGIRYYRVLIDSPELYYEDGWTQSLLKTDGLPLEEFEMEFLIWKTPDWTL